MRHRRPRTSVVPATLVADIERSLDTLDRSRAGLETTLRRPAPLQERRAARAAVGAAFADADRLLRRATDLARPGPYSEWRVWRHRLSQLDLAKQRHLFSESDDVACLDIGSVRIVDTGMEKPHIGELAYGHSRPPGAPAHYGLDMTAVLGAAVPQETVGAVTEEPAGDARRPAATEPSTEPSAEPSAEPSTAWAHAA